VAYGEYQRRVVAFLDILGFSALVERADEPEMRSAIEGVVRTMRQTLAPNELQDFRLSQFSDCVVLSAPGSAAGIHTVLSGAMILADNLLHRAVLLRGGVTIGNLIHNDDVMFGPALLVAHNMDASGAPPRVGIDDALAGQIAEWNTEFPMAGMLRTDPYDLTPMLRTLYKYEAYTKARRRGMEVLDENAAYLASMIVQQCHHAGHEPRVRAKWLWMERYWNEAVSKHRILPRTDSIT
jgi:hypothetical protein